MLIRKNSRLNSLTMINTKVTFLDITNTNMKSFTVINSRIGYLRLTNTTVNSFTRINSQQTQIFLRIHQPIPLLLGQKNHQQTQIFLRNHQPILLLLLRLKNHQQTLIRQRKITSACIIVVSKLQISAYFVLLNSINIYHHM